MFLGVSLRPSNGDRHHSSGKSPPGLACACLMRSFLSTKLYLYPGARRPGVVVGSMARIGSVGWQRMRNVGNHAIILRLNVEGTARDNMGGRSMTPASLRHHAANISVTALLLAA